MKPEKLITVMGTYITEEENIMLHTSTCQCGKLMVRSKKKESLNHYTDNPKYNAKCCQSQLTYTGEKLFNGNEIIEPIAIVEIKKVERNYLRSDVVDEEYFSKSQVIKEFAKNNNLPVTDIKLKREKVVKTSVEDTTGLLGEYLKKGITQSTLFNAIDGKYFNDELALAELFKAYPEQFQAALKYISAKKMVLINKVMEGNKVVS